MVAISITNWLRGASSGIDVDTNVVLLTDLNVIGSATISLQGMEVDDADYHRRTGGEGYTGLRRSSRHPQVETAAVGLAEGLASEPEDGSLVGSVSSEEEAGTVMEESNGRGTGGA